MSLLDLLNPIKAIADVASSIIKDFVADPAKKLELTEQLSAAQTALQSKVLDLQDQLVQAQTASVTAEEHGELWIQKAWRPIFSLTLVGILVYQAVVVSIFHLPSISFATVPPELWSTIKLCVGGYIGLRTVEKGLTTWVGTPNTPPTNGD